MCEPQKSQKGKRVDIERSYWGELSRYPGRCVLCDACWQHRGVWKTKPVFWPEERQNMFGESAQERRESYRRGAIQVINFYNRSRKNLKVTLKKIWYR